MPIIAQESATWLVQNVLVKGRTAQRNITFLQYSQGEAFWGELGVKLRVSNALSFEIQWPQGIRWSSKAAGVCMHAKVC